jgi:hypothetical protein
VRIQPLRLTVKLQDSYSTYFSHFGLYVDARPPGFSEVSRFRAEVFEAARWNVGVRWLMSVLRQDLGTSEDDILSTMDSAFFPIYIPYI